MVCGVFLVLATSCSVDNCLDCFFGILARFRHQISFKSPAWATPLTDGRVIYSKRALEPVKSWRHLSKRDPQQEISHNSTRTQPLQGEKMPGRCVVGGCSNGNDPERNISLHKIPCYGDDPLKRKHEEKNGLTLWSWSELSGSQLLLLEYAQSTSVIQRISRHSFQFLVSRDVEN